MLKNIERPVQAFSVKWEPSDWQQAVMAEVTVAPAIAPQAALPLPDKPSIAVLPFQNMSGDPEQEYFVDGLVEDIITALSRFKSLFVIARNSTFTYKGKVVDIKQVGRELGDAGGPLLVGVLSVIGLSFGLGGLAVALLLVSTIVMLTSRRNDTATTNST